jgi:hypothetical protein
MQSMPMRMMSDGQHSRGDRFLLVRLSRGLGNFLMTLMQRIQKYEDLASFYARRGLSRRARYAVERADHFRMVKKLRTEMLRARLKKSIAMANADDEFERAYETGEHSHAAK